MTNKIFDTLYKNLNSAQKKAVDSVEGPVMVVAGPGTGKTQVLTLRIANILKKTDTEPRSILALTFTESAAISMRRRLAEIIGSAAYSVTISTFHGFCNDVIKNYPENFPHIIGAQNITKVDQLRIFQELIDRLPLKELKPFGDTYYYLNSILTGVDSLKREGVEPKDYQKIVADEFAAFENIEDLQHEKGPHKGKVKGEYQKLLKKINKNEELAKIYIEYQKDLAKAKLYDYSDMIVEVLKALRDNPDLLLILQEQYQYVLVDEHQDTNKAQNKILELLCNFHANPNIFIVGDEKQAIFRFQGASLENFLYFKKLYPKAELVTLTENYRSTQAILDSAHSLLAGDKELKANTSYPEVKISLYAFSRPEVENYFLAEDIKEKLDSGVAPEEIAVLYRDNRDAFPIAHMLEKSGIPFAIESDQNILADLDIKKLILLMEAVEDFGSQEKFIEAMHIDFVGIAPLDIYKLIEYSNSRRMSALELAKDLKLLESAAVADPETMMRFYGNLSKWAVLKKNAGLLDFFETIIRESGFLSHILKGGSPVESMDKLNILFDEVKNFTELHGNSGLSDFFEYFNILKGHNVLIKRVNSGGGVDSVRLMTAHRSKGLEFDYVYIVNAYDGHWGNKRRPESLTLLSQVYSLLDKDLTDSEKNDDERRLFYVAITRAKREVKISYAMQNIDGREQLPTQFISEIKSELIKPIDTKKYEKGFHSHKEIIFAPSLRVGIDIKNKKFITEMFMRNGISVTALNNYLNCPWKYFYTNLLRIPRAKSKHQMYGTAIHASLKDFFDKLKESKVTERFLIDQFRYYADREIFLAKDFKEVLVKGEKALSGYYKAYSKNWNSNTLSEFSVVGVMLDKDLRLTGKIDKIELGADRDVVVVDYKTSKPKTRREIEGSTKNSNGDIKRQLIFYNLLLNKYEDGRKFHMVSGDIDFIEPDEKGRYHKESFVINKEEVVELEQTIRQVAKEILNLEFWDRFCDDKDCEFCAIRNMMQ